jgi:hypothetical protein
MMMINFISLPKHNLDPPRTFPEFGYSELHSNAVPNQGRCLSPRDIPVFAGHLRKKHARLRARDL